MILVSTIFSSACQSHKQVSTRPSLGSSENSSPYESCVHGRPHAPPWQSRGCYFSAGVGESQVTADLPLWLCAQCDESGMIIYLCLAMSGTFTGVTSISGDG